MVPPILEVYPIWHPDDGAAAGIAEALFRHFHQEIYAGLVGGAVEVYFRSETWQLEPAAPRPIPGVMPEGLGSELGRAHVIALVPIVDVQLLRAVENDAGGWARYIEACVAAASKDASVALLPVRVPGINWDGSRLMELLGGFQALGEGPGGEDHADRVCRDLSQAIAQLEAIGGRTRLQIFVSHTRRARNEAAIAALIACVRRSIGETRLAEFVDAHDLQPGEDWSTRLIDEAATSALLAIRTDTYPSREWCQREVLVAKQHGMPVVIASALLDGEQRGSFIMDHVPRLPLRRTADGVWNEADVLRCLTLLTDEALKRRLWALQRSSGNSAPDAVWLPHAPEPVTLVGHLRSARSADRLLVLHPDPPLGGPEIEVLQGLAAAISGCVLDIVTPRILAARGG